MARKKRETASYLSAARRLAPYVPRLAKYKRRKTLKPSEKAAISRYENLIPFTTDLKPVSKRRESELKEFFYRPITTVLTGKRKGQRVEHGGIRAIMMRNTADDVDIQKIDKGLMLESNGRQWVYWKLPEVTKKAIQEMAEAAFESPEAYQVDRVIELAKAAFANPKTKGVYLWTIKGRSGKPIKTFKSFLNWLHERWEKYENQDEWIKGLTIMVADAGEKISDREWADWGLSSAKLRARRQAERDRQAERELAERQRREREPGEDE